MDLKETSITIKGTSDKQTYEFSTELFGEILPEESKYSVLGLHMTVLLMKKDKEAEYWTRLTKENRKF